MTDANDTHDDTSGQDDDYEPTRGDRFAVNTDPTVTEVLVLDTMLISGYEGVLLTEKDARTGEWADPYPNKAQYLKDELNLDMVEALEPLPETDVQGVEGGLSTGLDSPTTAPEGVEPVSSLDD